MRRHRANRFLLLLAALLCVVGLAAACSSDSPSEPRQEPPPTPPGTAPPSGDFSITVTANPADLSAGGDEPALITIQVRRRSDGQAPANGTTIALSTTLGELGSPGSGQQSGFAELINGAAQVFLFPGTIEGLAVVQARLENSVGQANVRILGRATFFLSHVEPSSGSPQGGQQVTVVGGGFAEPVRVTFDGVVAQVQSVSTDRIRVLTPPSSQPVPTGTTRPVNVQVTINLNEEDQAIDLLASGYVYAPGGGTPNQPQVFSVTPASGVNEGGTQVTINGDGFDAPVQVFFGSGSSASNFTGVEATVVSVTRTRIVVVTPAATGFGQDNRNQRVDILVKNLDSGFSAVALGAFRYGTQILITAVSPDTIPFDGQTRVTIFGQGFDEPVAVGLAGIAATPLSVTGTEIIVRAGVPFVEDCANLDGPVTVTNIETGDSASEGNFTYLVTAPVITGVSPNSGTGNGGTTVTISGALLFEPLRVFFGDAGASLVSASPDGSSVTVLTPSFNEFDEESCDDNGDGQQGMRFVPTAVDVTVTNLITTCEDEFTGGFTYVPPDQSCRGDVAPVEPMPPEANFEFTVSGMQVNFVDTSTNNPTSWMWQFGDPGNSTSTQQNPVFTYAAPGSYTVTLTVSNADGTDSVAMVVVIM